VRGKSGKWDHEVLYSFCSASECTDGFFPNGRLVFDTAGNLYGSTLYGGIHTSGCGGNGCGTVFELVRGKYWTEKLLNSFDNNGKDGAFPNGGLAFDTTGNLYGTANQGGNLTACGGFGCGVVFELLPAKNGKWAEKVLHRFEDSGKDGVYPGGGLILDAAGNLYGSAEGGANKSRRFCEAGCGTVFEVDAGHERKVDRSGVAQLQQ
jgi:hypothetical protein